MCNVMMANEFFVTIIHIILYTCEKIEATEVKIGRK